ncbi:permease [Geosporobacter ferrireducens]|uniref:Permease n=1 Tax=Geosporobacter ferrireducens TaxID=1424294 RepID=A0A1D8GMZ2_9FIRM|nr:permease [Geosporobacter ferrireducens]AOT72316.1 permease [Geosporobacter ferrireducens]MTI56436.1 permease [Geosporobacter ferrireducens]
MEIVFTGCLYGIMGILLILSFIKSKAKTSLALKKAWKMFLSVLPQFLAVLIFVGLMLAVVQRETIQAVIGSESGGKGVCLSALLGSAAAIPALIAFPIASELLKSGAGLIQINVFIFTLTTVSLVTMPLEIKYLGRKITLLRNLLALIFSFIAAFIIGGIFQ